MSYLPITGPVSWGIMGGFDSPLIQEIGACCDCEDEEEIEEGECECPPGEVTFRFPQSVFVAGIVLNVRRRNSDTDADYFRKMGQVTLQIIDETQQNVISDGQGTKFTLRGNALASRVIAPLFGELVVVKPYPILRPVVRYNEWQFIVRVEAEDIFPELHLLVEDLESCRHAA